MPPNMKKKGLLNYIGVDIGKRNCIVCIMDSNRSIIKETNYYNTLEQAESFASSIKRKHGTESTAVCESTGNLWLKTYQAFEKHDIDVKLANPLKTKAIAEARITPLRNPHLLIVVLLQQLVFGYCCCLLLLQANTDSLSIFLYFL